MLEQHSDIHPDVRPDVRPLLVELYTEELPPKALPQLGAAFAGGLRAGLAKHGLLTEDCTSSVFATPRRLAVRLSAVRAQAPEQPYAERLMPVKVGLSADGSASPALVKKLAAKGWAHLEVASLARESDGKQDYLVARGTAPGIALAAGVQAALAGALDGLPIPKVMRYQLADGQTTVRFVRPAHGLVALFGADIVPVTALGLQAGRTLHGHRFLSPAPIALAHASQYESQLAQAHVLASFSERRARIAAQLQTEATRLQASLGKRDEVDVLLDEVTALVEWPRVYAGEFDAAFLAVPPECLTLTMRLNQKYFPLFDPASGKLTHRFLIVSNIETADPSAIIAGNQRVVHPRLADAQFFFETDRKQPLAARVPALAQAVYHNKLGSQWQRSQRIEQIARWLAQHWHAGALPAEAGGIESISLDALHAHEERVARAAQLLKADLTTDMVAEFPELQGIMGAYYAQADGEDAAVVAALRGQYAIRFPETLSATNLLAAIVFVAERAEALVGIWGIGLKPTGERDPYALRRAALGLISVFEQPVVGRLLHLDQLLEAAWKSFPAGVLGKPERPEHEYDPTVDEVAAFISERYRNQLYGEYERAMVEAVMALAPPLFEVRARIDACVAFLRLPEAASLIAANKRLGNLLKKATDASATLDVALLVEPAEQTLAQVIERLTPVVQAHLMQQDYSASLSALAGAREAVDDFFEHVMVMAEDPALRANRLALLARLHGLMNRVADIARLPV